MSDFLISHTFFVQTFFLYHIFHGYYIYPKCVDTLTLNAPIAAKVVCFSRLLKCLRSLYGKQCGPRSNCSYRSSLFWVHAVCLYTEFVSNVRQLFAADDFSRGHFQMHFYLGAHNYYCKFKLVHFTSCLFKVALEPVSSYMYISFYAGLFFMLL